MSIEINCPNPGCNKVLGFADEQAGQVGQCPNCHSHLSIPRPGENSHVIVPRDVSIRAAAPRPQWRPRWQVSGFVNQTLATARTPQRSRLLIAGAVGGLLLGVVVAWSITLIGKSASIGDGEDPPAERADPLLPFERQLAKRCYREMLDDLQPLMQKAPNHADLLRLRGQAHLGLGSADEARKDLARSLELKSDARTMSYLARAHALRGDFKEADAFHERAVSEAPKSSLVYELRAQTHVAAGRHESAAADAERAAGLAPKRAEALVARAEVALAQSKLDDAVRFSAEALKLDGELAAAFLVRAQARLWRYEFPAAREDCEAALRLSPRDAVAFQLRGDVSQANYESDRALSDYGRAIELAPGSAVAREKRGWAYLDRGERGKAADDFKEVVRLTPEPADAAGFALRGSANAGLAFGGTGEYAAALTPLNEALKRDPLLVSALYRRAWVHAQMYAGKSCVADSSKLIELNSRNTAAYVLRAMGHITSFEADLAVKDCTDALAIFPRHAEAYLQRSNAYRRRGKAPLAVADCDEALKVRPNWAAAFHARALARKLMGEARTAVADFDEAVRLDPSNETILIDRGDLYRDDLHQEQKAVDDYSAAVKLAPKSVPAYFRRAETYERMQEYDKAIGDYTTLMQVLPTSAGFYHFRRGNIHRKRNAHDLAIDDYTRALASNWKYTETYYNRGLVYQARGDSARGDLDKALADFTEAIKLSRFSADAYRERAYVYGLKKEYESAIKDYTEAVRLAERPEAKAEIYNLRGVCYFRQPAGFDKAHADFTEAIRLEPGKALYYCNRADAALQKKDYRQVISDADEAIRLNPLSDYAFYLRGKAHQAQNELAEAISDFDSALVWKPKRTEYLEARALANIARAVRDQTTAILFFGLALRDIDQLIEADNRSAEYRYWRGWVHEKRQNYEAATSDYEKAIELDASYKSKVTRYRTAYLRVTNKTNKTLTVYVQYEYETKEGELVWYPKANESRVWSLPPGDTAFFTDDGWKLRARRVHIWAKTDSGAWTKYRNEDLWLCPEAGYLATEKGTFAYTFAD